MSVNPIFKSLSGSSVVQDRPEMSLLRVLSWCSCWIRSPESSLLW